MFITWALLIRGVSFFGLIIFGDFNAVVKDVCLLSWPLIPCQALTLIGGRQLWTLKPHHNWIIACLIFCCFSKNVPVCFDWPHCVEWVMEFDSGGRQQVVSKCEGSHARLVKLNGAYCFALPTRFSKIISKPNIWRMKKVFKKFHLT